MPTTITGSPGTSHGNPVSFSAPADGDAANAASVDTALQALADTVSALQADDPTLAGNNTFTGSNTFNNPVTVATPTASGHAATKNYVDTVNIQTAQQGASGQTVSATSFVDITNLNATITTHGRAVLISLVGDSANTSQQGIEVGGTNAFSLQLLRGGTAIWETDYSSAGGTITFPPPGLIAVDVPSAGTYTYKIQGEVNSSFGIIQGMKLVVVEL